MLIEDMRPPMLESIVSGEHAFWLLEDEVCRLKFLSGLETVGLPKSLDAMIAQGEVRQEVAEGYLIEVAHIVRSVAQELALAISNAASENIRDLYVDYFKDECDHGKMIFDKLKAWIPEDKLRRMRPLPATLAVINMYREFASECSLTYAAALLYCESSPLDPPVERESNPYAGLRTYFSIPGEVVEIFEWHSDLDREAAHGFFPLKIFRCYDHLNAQAISQLRERVTALAETFGMFYRNILEYYNDHTIFDRLAGN
jgi:hypothetical protein